ncbi:MAG: hypothetical protein WCI71_04715 [Bacteroidota bacterium]
MKIDPNGWEYYNKLPVGFRLATLDDFTLGGKRKTGMQFLIKWCIRDDYYQICTVGPSLFSKNLIPFIEDGRVFVLADPMTFTATDH